MECRRPRAPHAAGIVDEVPAAAVCSYWRLVSFVGVAGAAARRRGSTSTTADTRLKPSLRSSIELSAMRLGPPPPAPMPAGLRFVPCGRFGGTSLHASGREAITSTLPPAHREERASRIQPAQRGFEGSRAPARRAIWSVSCALAIVAPQQPSALEHWVAAAMARRAVAASRNGKREDITEGRPAILQIRKITPGPAQERRHFRIG